MDEDLLDEMQRRIEDNRDILTRRKAIVEHPFGTIKWSMDQGYFLMKGIPKTSAEMSLSFLAYRSSSLTGQHQKSIQDPGGS